jgi:hypothetical protein
MVDKEKSQHMKTQFTTMALFAALAVSAQDTIIKLNNERIIGKVMEISPLEIKYKRADLPDGPMFTEKVANISKIKYPGREEIYSQSVVAEKPLAEKKPAAVDMSTRYIVTMTNGTQLRGKMITENTKEIVFEDNNIGQKTISREKIKSINLQYGDATRIFTLKDGSIISGKIVNKSDEYTVVQTTDLGNFSLDNEEIKSVRDLEEGTITSEGKIWFKNPNCTRYLFAPSAIPLKKGEGYYQNLYGAGSAWNYGVTKNISLGGGLVGPVGAYINGKVGFKLGEHVHAAAGVFLGNSFFPIGGDNFGMGMGFAVVTLGNYDHNITVGSGYGFINSEGDTRLFDKPLFVANGMARVGRKFALVTENWVINFRNDPFQRGIKEGDHYETIFSYAFRYMGENSTLDAGFLNTPGLIENGWYIGIPYIGFVVRFGKYKDN